MCVGQDWLRTCSILGHSYAVEVPAASTIGSIIFNLQLLILLQYSANWSRLYNEMITGRLLVWEAASDRFYIVEIFVFVHFSRQKKAICHINLYSSYTKMVHGDINKPVGSTIYSTEVGYTVLKYCIKVVLVSSCIELKFSRREAK